MSRRGDGAMIRILIADDHTLLREAVCDMLRMEEGFQVVGEAADGESAVLLARSLQPDVVLLDVGMPGNPPGLTVRRLKEIAPDTAIIIVSMFTERRLIQELLDRGVRGYLHKSVSRQELASAIRGISRRDHGQVVISAAPSVLPAPAESDSQLSPREHEILVLVADAMSNRQIAGKLGITEGTVKRHMRNIFGKLGAVSRIDAVNKAVADALIVPPSVSSGRHVR
ncbi:response regulator [Streptomyces polygonati]|uniref:Response regulator n=1 Tax=Streptomyces polygonati TaxID=1617087 RepID=A0ABV8HKB4_9ACTN